MSSIPSCNQVATPPGTKIRAIPTEYADIRFRSRVEARWAVFFDTLNVLWCYEAEGYELPDGTMYLPDFYIPAWDCTVEIKGVAEPDEKIKCAVLSDCLQRRVMLLEGFPTLGSYRATSYIPGDEPPCSLVPNCRFAHDRKDENVFWMVSDECACTLDKALTEHDRWPVDDDQFMLEAYEAARSYWPDYRSQL